MTIDVKFFEVRDVDAFIPVMASLLSPGRGGNKAEKFLLARAGYGGNGCVLLTHLNTNETHFDEYGWSPATRTMTTAHKFIAQTWDQLESGMVIDVEFILGESTFIKTSERLETYDA